MQPTQRRALSAVTLLLLTLGGRLAGAQTTVRVSVASDGTEGNDVSMGSALSADGRFVAFDSAAADLVAGDTNRVSDVFVHDRQTGTTERVSVASDGAQGNGSSGLLSFAFPPALSADGRFVAFVSFATNLVAGDTNGATDVFVHDRQTGTTERVSVASDGTQGNAASAGAALSADGRFVAFHSTATNLVAGDTNGKTDVFVHDRQTGITERVSVASDGTQGNNASSYPALSADGRFVAFDSDATDLVAGDTNGTTDVFVHDRQTGTTERVSVASGGGTQGNGNSGGFFAFPALSADGRFVAFQSDATNLAPGDTNGATDVFVRDRQTGMTERVSVASDGTQANNASSYPALSADGRFVAFQSDATNLVAGDTNGATDVFVHDRQTGATERVSVASGGGTQGNRNSGGFFAFPALSADGRLVAFQSDATNLVARDTNGATDVFVHDRQTGTTERVSVASGGSQGNGFSAGPVLSADGRLVAFHSTATNLVARDTNGATDVFVHDRQTGTTERVSVASGGTQGNDSSAGPVLSADGGLVAFHSTATNLVSGDANGAYDVFVHELTVSTTTTSTTQPATTSTSSTTTSVSVTSTTSTSPTTSSSTTRPPTTTSTTTQPTTTTTTTRPTTTTLACEPAQLAEDSLAGVECAIGAVRATLNSPPQPACECKHCSLEAVLERIAGFVMQADGATRPKKCKRNLGKAGRAAKALRARVASMTRRNCLAPADRVARLDSEVVDLARRTRALFKSRFCAST